MKQDKTTDETNRHGFSVGVDWLLSGVIQLSVGAAAAAFFGQIYPEWSFAIFIWGVMAARIVQHSVSLEFDDDGREKLVFSWPWVDDAERD